MSESMQVAVFTDSGKLEIEKCPIPTIESNNVLVKIDACAICTWEQRVYSGIKNVDFPFIGGHEMVGHIVEMGDEIDRNQWRVGDKVVIGVMLACDNCFQCKTGNAQNCQNFNHSKHLKGLPHKGMGGFSEYLLVETKNMFHYDTVTPEEASISEPLSCVIHSVESADVQLGDSVLVIGCGIMGLLHVVVSLKKGAQVIVSDPDEGRLEMARALGASVAINPTKEDLSSKIQAITKGIGAQVIFDTTPISKVVEETFKCVSNTGKVVLYSSFYPDVPIAFSPDWLHKQGVQIMGTANSNHRDFMRATSLISKNIVDMKPFVSETYAFANIENAFKSALQGDKFRVVLKFEEK